MVSYNPVIEYFSKSTIHGLNHFGDRERHWIERTFWVVTFIISMFGCFFMVHKTYTKWQESPIIITQDDRFTPVSEIPFPAVTICPIQKIGNSNAELATTSTLLLEFFQNKTQYGEAEATEDNLKLSEADKATLNITDDDIRLIKAASLPCKDYFVPDHYVKLVYRDLKETEIEDLLKTNRPILSNMMSHSILKNDPMERYKNFPWVLTEQGICFTFNSLGNFQIFKKDEIAPTFRPFQIDETDADWNPENGYKFNQSTPRKAFKSAASVGLRIVVSQTEYESKNSCPWAVNRLKIFVNSPGEFPTSAQKLFSIPYAVDVSVAVKPVMMTTTADLVRYSTEIRQCYFNKERSLKFYNFYTQKNCEHECFTNFTLATCGCAGLSMPRDNATKICGPFKMICYRLSRAFFEAIMIDGVQKHAELMLSRFNLTSEQLKSIETPCNCLPSCVSLEYEYSTAQSDSIFEGLSQVQIYFDAASFMKLKRSELYGWGDFIANCGGLLGLFMGVSILSLIEIVYYATLRLFCTCQLNKQKVGDEVTIIQTKRRNDCRIILEPEIIDWDKF